MSFWRYFRDVIIIRGSYLFDSKYYSAKYGVPKFAAAFHYARKKWRNNTPSAVFSSRRYYDLYPDVYSAGDNALSHYIRCGEREKRIYRSDNDCILYDHFFTQSLFDMKFYTETYMTREERTSINPIEHYSEKGWKLGYLPNGDFDLADFHKQYPTCDINPLLYCLQNRVPRFFTTKPLPLAEFGYLGGVYKSYIHMLKQDAEINKMYPHAAACKKLIWFLVTDQDCISGGLMSICGMYDLSRKLSYIHGCEVIASTLPQGDYLSGYSFFDNDMVIFRYDQIPYRFPNVEEVHIMLPEICVRTMYDYLSSAPDGYLAGIPIRHLNIMNQNIELMPYEFEVDRLKRYFTMVTQTTAHRRYTTRRIRDLYGIPTHQIIPPIKKNIVVTPYEEKEDLFLYSPDDHPHKAAILRRLKAEFPSMKFVEIRDILFREYLNLISRAKWAMSFGEGLDGYFVEPYCAGGVAFTVWNDAFFTDKYRDLPTIFESYEDAVNTLPALMRNLDSKEAYERANADVLKVWRSEYEGKRTPEDMMIDFFCGKYDYT